MFQALDVLNVHEIYSMHETIISCIIICMYNMYIIGVGNKVKGGNPEQIFYFSPHIAKSINKIPTFQISNILFRGEGEGGGAGQERKFYPVKLPKHF